MKILFVLSGNQPRTTIDDGSVLVKIAKNQGDSMLRMGVDIDYFYIIGKGLFGYLKNIPKLIHTVNKGEYDI